MVNSFTSYLPVPSREFLFTTMAKGKGTSRWFEIVYNLCPNCSFPMECTRSVSRLCTLILKEVIVSTPLYTLRLPWVPGHKLCTIKLTDEKNFFYSWDFHKISH